MKWRARAFNVLLSSARQRLTPLFSNYFLQICAGEERQRRGGSPITPRSARLLVPGGTPMLQPSSSGTAPKTHRRGAGGRDRDAAHLSEVAGQGGEQLLHGLVCQLLKPSSPLRSHQAAFQHGWVRVRRRVGSQQLCPLVAASFPFQNPAVMAAAPPACRDWCENTADTPGAGFPLGADISLLSPRGTIRRSASAGTKPHCWHRARLQARLHSPAPGYIGQSQEPE